MSTLFGVLPYLLEQTTLTICIFMISCLGFFNVEQGPKRTWERNLCAGLQITQNYLPAFHNCFAHTYFNGSFFLSNSALLNLFKTFHLVRKKKLVKCCKHTRKQTRWTPVPTSSCMNINILPYLLHIFHKGTKITVRVETSCMFHADFISIPFSPFITNILNSVQLFHMCLYIYYICVTINISLCFILHVLNLYVNSIMLYILFCNLIFLSHHYVFEIYPC